MAIPGISTGAFGFPKDLAARIIIKGIISFLEDSPDTTIKEIVLIDMDKGMVEEFVKEIRKRTV